MFGTNRIHRSTATSTSGMLIGSVFLGGLLAGCASDDVAQVPRNQREVITYAATAKYPGGVREFDKVRAVALNYSDRERIEIHNLRETPISASAVWVNGAFVRPLDRGGIPPRGYVTVRYGNLLEAGPGTNDFESLDRSVERVELQTPDGLIRVDGPIAK